MKSRRGWKKLEVLGVIKKFGELPKISKNFENFFLKNFFEGSKKIF
jgi:hypothetical protein